jgi:uncharacterized protein (TIGR00369 family)
VSSFPESLAESINQKLTGHDRALGLEVTFASKERIEARLVIDERHLQLYGLVHGGVYTSIVETLGSVGAWLSAGSETRPVVGVDNHTSFVRAVRQGTLHAVAEPVHSGRRNQLWDVKICDDEGKLAATGRLLAMVLEEPPNKKTTNDSDGGQVKAK